MKKGALFHITTTLYIIFVLVARFMWMPYMGPMTMEWPFFIVRWAFYAVAIGVANLFFYMTLTNFRCVAGQGFFVPMGLRIGLDVLILLSEKHLGAFSATFRCVLDILFLVLAGICITRMDRKKKRWRRGKITKAGRIALAVLLALVLAMILLIQIDVFKITHKYVKDSRYYVDSIELIAIKAYAFSLVISFLVQYAMVLFFIDEKQDARLRAKGNARSILLFNALFVLLVVRYVVYPPYFMSLFSGGGYVKMYDDKVSSGFYDVDQSTTFYRLNQAREKTDEGFVTFRQIYDRDYERNIRFAPAEMWYYFDLRVNGYKVFYLSPYALFYYCDQGQQMLLFSDIQSHPKDHMLTEVLKQGIIYGDFHCFEHGAGYLKKFDPEFVQPYIARYARGEFTLKEQKDMGDIRPEYVREVAQRLND